MPQHITTVARPYLLTFCSSGHAYLLIPPPAYGYMPQDMRRFAWALPVARQEQE